MTSLSPSDSLFVEDENPSAENKGNWTAADGMPDQETLDTVTDDFMINIGNLQEDRADIANATSLADDLAHDGPLYVKAIVTAVEKHIKKVGARQKLAGLYLLDSIVKTVTWPNRRFFRDYFAANLFSTFMDAYQRMEESQRKQMHAMLKTWKQSYPEEDQPVLPPHVTSHIENALLQVLTKAARSQQRQPTPYRQAQPRKHPMPQGHAWRPNSASIQPSGPHMAPPNAVPPAYGHMYPSSGPPGYQMPPQYPPQQPHHMPPQHQAPPYQQSPYQQSPNQASPYQATPQQPPPYQPPYATQSEKASLLPQVSHLVAQASRVPALQHFAEHLPPLYKILSSTDALARNHFETIKQRISELSKNLTAPQTNGTPVAVAQPNTTPSPQPFRAPSVSSSTPTPAPPSLNSTNLAQLLASYNPGRSNTPTTQQGQIPPISSTTPSANPDGLAEAVAGDPMLQAALRARGSLPTTNAGPQPGSAPPQHSVYDAPPSQSSAASMLAALNASQQNATQTQPQPVHYGVELTTASIKIPRPHLTKFLCKQQAEQCTTQCSTCGRRFTTDAVGKARKARHLDYHFRTNSALANATQRIIHRSWYCNEREWINTREVDEADEDTDAVNGANTQNGGKDSSGKQKAVEEPRTKYVKAPEDAFVGNQTCPICQEKFEVRWHNEAQEWVLMDAMEIGERTFHASCNDELSHSESTAAQASTPTLNGVLGKRKADNQGGRYEVKREALEA